MTDWWPGSLTCFACSLAGWSKFHSTNDASRTACYATFGQPACDITRNTVSWRGPVNIAPSAWPNELHR